MKQWYTLRVVLLMVLLSGLSAFSVFLLQNRLYFSFFFTLLAIICFIACICYYQNRTTHLILRLVESLRYDDFSLNFSTHRKSALERRLCEEINETVAGFRKRISQQQERYQYYEILLDTVDCCLLITDRKGHIHWMNNAAVQDLCGHQIHSLKELNQLNRDFSGMISLLQPGEVKVIRIYREDFIQEMAVTITEYTGRDTYLRLVNLKNIRSVLEENEMEAWQKLIRVLTHEIMNSIAPIISLSETLVDRTTLQQHKGGCKDEVMIQGMKTIHRRSTGLLEFVENYRKLSRIPLPMLAPVAVGELLGDVRKLVPHKDITYRYQVEDEGQMLMIDRSQIEQVLINLLKNAAEACAEEEHPVVTITTTYSVEKRIFQLTVSDNGCGILPEVVDKIFVPFFTTKQKGSGIGLSLCKQIMNLHGGSISVKSEAGEGAAFTLKFLCKEK